jgi:hypothetical protein
MSRGIALVALILLAACQSGPQLEDDTRYVRLAKVVDVHVYTDAERKDAKMQKPSDSRVGVGVSVGVGTGGGFGGLMVGAGSMLGGSRHDQNEPPQAAYGANRYTVETLEKRERFEVMSYGNYKIGDCVKVMMGHPTEFARLFDLKLGETCTDAVK